MNAETAFHTGGFIRVHSGGRIFSASEYRVHVGPFVSRRLGLPRASRHHRDLSSIEHFIFNVFRSSIRIGHFLPRRLLQRVAPDGGISTPGAMLGGFAQDAPQLGPEESLLVSLLRPLQVRLGAQHLLQLAVLTGQGTRIDGFLHHQDDVAERFAHGSLLSKVQLVVAPFAVDKMP